MSHPRLRPVFDDLASYRPDPAGLSGSGRRHPLHANESPHDPLPEIVEAVAAAAAGVNRYPDFHCADLVREIARVHSVSENQVALGAGSVALLQVLLQAVSEPGAEVVHAWRSFELYPILAELSGVRTIRVPLVDEYHDLSRMVDAITDRTRLIVICNPNNPTGTVLSQDRLREFVDAVPPDCLMALDEAYHEYVRHPGVPDGRSLLAGRPNLVVLRTFSKAYGLAGLRVGYLMGDDHVVSQLRKACLPFSLSRVAQAAARTALRVRDRLFERVEATVAERTRVRDALLAAGWKIPRSEANFLWLRLGERSTGFGRWCAAAGVEVRTFPGEGVRVSIGSPEDNDAFLAVVAGWRAGAREGSAC